MLADRLDSVQWDLLNDTGIVDFRITLLLLNDGLNQSIPPGLSTTMNQLNPMPTASVNETIMTGDASKTMSYVMNVSVPQGRYYVQGSINDLYGTNAQSNVFSVVETDDISCLNGTPGASSTSPNPNISAGSSKQSGGDSSGESGGGGIPGGAIAGVVIGALVLIAATIFGCMYYRRKKNIRRNRPISGAWIGGTFTRGMRSDMLHESDFQQIREVPRERFGSITALSSGGNTVDESSAEHEDRNRRSRMESPPPDEPAVGFAAYLRRSDGPRSP